MNLSPGRTAAGGVVTCVKNGGGELILFAVVVLRLEDNLAVPKRVDHDSPKLS